MTLKDIQALKSSKKDAKEFFYHTYKVNLGLIKKENEIGFSEILEWSPTDYIIPKNSIYYPNFLAKLLNVVEQEGQKDNSSLLADFLKALSESTEIYTCIIFKNIGKLQASNIIIASDLKNLSSFKVVHPSFLLKNKINTIQKSQIQLDDATYSLKFKTNLLNPDHYQFLLLKSTGGYPKKENFHVKMDAFEMPDKSMAMKAVIIGLMLTILVVIYDIYCFIKKRDKERFLRSISF